MKTIRERLLEKGLLSEGGGWKALELCPLDFEEVLTEEEFEVFWKTVEKLQKYHAEKYPDPTFDWI